MSINCGRVTHVIRFSEICAARRHRLGFPAHLLCIGLLSLAAPDGHTQLASEVARQTVDSGVAELRLDQAVAIALQNNPDLAGLQARASAMRALPSQAGALPDPALTFGAMNVPTDTFDFDQEPMTQLQLGLSQSFPFPGKRKLRREASEHEAQAAEEFLSERRVALAGQVRAAWWRLMSLDRSLEIIDQNQLLLRDFVEIAETKFRVGNGLQQDVLLAQLELSRLIDRELRLEGMRHSARAELNALLGRPADWRIRLPNTPPNTILPELPTEQVLLEQAGGDRPLITAQRDLVEAARARLDLAEKDRFPDIRLGVGYGYRQGFDPMRNADRSDFMSVMLTVDLPIYARSKQSKAVEQRSFEVSQRKFMLGDTLRRVQSAISGGLADYHAARDQVVLLESAIIPQAQQTVASMLAGYQVNQVDFLNLVNTQITLYNAQVNYWESLSRAKQALAQVAAAVGQEALYE